MPTESKDGKDGRSGTFFPEKDKKCSCKCECPKRGEKGKCFIKCKVSFTAEIVLGAKDVIEYSETWTRIYGHEQRHVVSRTRRVQAVVDEMNAQNEGPFSSRGTCDASLKKWYPSVCKKFLAALDTKHTKDHVGDEGATPDSPTKGVGETPLTNTDQNILDGLRRLDELGYNGTPQNLE
jgi:hypothetical protein